MSEQQDYRDRLPASDRAQQILHLITSETATYPSAIAVELDAPVHSISNYLNALRTAGLIQRIEKEGRKQHYRTTAKADTFIDLLTQRTEIDERIHALLYEEEANTR